MALSLLRLFLALAAAGLLLALSIPDQRGLSKREVDTVRFLHVNDIHSRLIPARRDGAVCPPGQAKFCVGGWPRLMGKVNQIRAQDPDRTLFVNLGDDASGTAFFSETEMTTIAKYLNEANLDAWTIGNHEFDRTEFELWKLIKHFNKPLRDRILGGNIHFKGNSEAHIGLRGVLHPDEPYILNPKHKLVMFGLSPANTGDGSKPSKDVVFEDELPAAKRILEQINKLKEVREEGYRIIGLTHVGYEVDVDIAEQYADLGVAAILGGHSHTGLRKNAQEYMVGDPSSKGGRYPTVVNGVCIVQAAMYGRYLGDLTLEFEGNKLKNCHGDFYELTSKYDAIADPGMTQVIGEIQKPLKHLEKIIGTSGMLIEKGRRFEMATTAGNWYSDLIYNAAKAEDDDVDFAFLTGGSVTADVPEGQISLAQLGDLDPYDDQIGIWELSGKDLWEVFEGVYSRKNAHGKTLAVQTFAHFSKGCQVRYDRSDHSKDGDRLKAFQIDGRDISMHKKYKFATTKWLLDGYESIFTPDQVKTAADERTIVGKLKAAMLREIEKKVPLQAKLENRIISEHPWVLDW